MNKANIKAKSRVQLDDGTSLIIRDTPGSIMASVKRAYFQFDRNQSSLLKMVCAKHNNHYIMNT
jgi:hypothetical protein